jgi:hypothetical protein
VFFETRDFAVHRKRTKTPGILRVNLKIAVSNRPVSEIPGLLRDASTYSKRTKTEGILRVHLNALSIIDPRLKFPGYLAPASSVGPI